MNRKFIYRLASVVLATVLLFPLISQADDLRSAMLANPCAGCHGPDGDSPGSIPALKNLSAKYISISMKAFKSDQRSGTIMNRIAKGYSDEEIDLMAQYFEDVKKRR